MVAITYLPQAESCQRPKGRAKRASVNPIKRDPANKVKFANDGSLASVELLLYKLAVKCYARVQAMGLSMDFDDVRQEMYSGYVKSTHKWNPNGAALFSTYCTTVCLNNFNNAIAKMERDRASMGMESIDSFGTKGESGEPVNAMEVMMSAAAPESDRPEMRLENSQQMQERLASLSEGGRRFIQLLLLSERDPQQRPPKLRDIALTAGLQGDELKRVKVEILKTFGVRWS